MSRMDSPANPVEYANARRAETRAGIGLKQIDAAHTAKTNSNLSPRFSHRLRFDASGAMP